MEAPRYSVPVTGADASAPPSRARNATRPDQSRIATLPPEILTQVLQKLSVKYIGRVATTCKTLMVIIHTNQELWKGILARDEPYWLDHVVANSYLETVKQMPLIWREKDEVRILKELDPPTKWRWALMLFWPHRISISSLISKLLKMPPRSHIPKEGVNSIYSKRLKLWGRPLNLVLIDSVRQSIIHGSECGACTAFVHIVDLEDAKSFKVISKTVEDSYGYNPRAKQYIWGVYKGDKKPENEELAKQIQDLRKQYETKSMMYIHYAEMNYRTGANVRNTFYALLMTLVDDARKAEAQLELTAAQKKRLSAVPAARTTSPQSIALPVQQQRPKSVTNPLSLSVPSPRSKDQKDKSSGSKCSIS